MTPPCNIRARPVLTVKFLESLLPFVPAPFPAPFLTGSSVAILPVLSLIICTLIKPMCENVRDLFVEMKDVLQRFRDFYCLSLSLQLEYMYTKIGSVCVKVYTVRMTRKSSLLGLDEISQKCPREKKDDALRRVGTVEYKTFRVP
jgi:hypothetical protein